MKLARRVGKVLWVHCDGRTYAVESDNPGRAAGAGRRAGPLGSQSGALKSPMPGKVIKMDFKGGERVRAGQTVCVIEAMKMEYALKAPFEAKIKDVFKKAGDQVLADERVALLEELP